MNGRIMWRIRRGMRVNMSKTKVMISGERQKPVQKAAGCLSNFPSLALLP